MTEQHDGRPAVKDEAVKDKVVKAASDRAPIHVFGGIDIGNGYVKASVGDDTEIDLPSVAAVAMGKNPLPLDDDKAMAWALGGTKDSTVKDDVYNTFDASFQSSLIPDANRRIFGRSGLSATSVVEEFSIAGFVQEKSTQPLSVELVYGIIGAWALKRHIISHDGHLPDTQIDVEATLGLSLPIAEYIRRRGSFKSDLLANPALVICYNFVTPVIIRITVRDVRVVAEGASAQLAIVNHGETLMDLMLKEVRERGVALEGVTSRDVLDARNFIGVDIGEGTVNFPVFTNGDFNPQTSVTLQQGYGTVLERALEAMRSEGVNMGFNSRKQLADYLLHEPNALARASYRRVCDYVEQQRIFFAKTIVTEFTRLQSVVGGANEVVYVYGGGANPMKDTLYDRLLKASVAPVFYLDSTYSRKLNREGLVIAARL